MATIKFLLCENATGPGVVALTLSIAAALLGPGSSSGANTCDLAGLGGVGESYLAVIVNIGVLDSLKGRVTALLGQNARLHWVHGGSLDSLLKPEDL